MNNKELQANLFEAIAEGNYRRVEVLIDMGVNVAIERLISPLSNSPAYATPIQYAIDKGCDDIVELLSSAVKNGIISKEDSEKASLYIDEKKLLKIDESALLDRIILQEQENQVIKKDKKIKVQNEK